MRLRVILKMSGEIAGSRVLYEKWIGASRRLPPWGTHASKTGLSDRGQSGEMLAEFGVWDKVVAGGGNVRTPKDADADECDGHDTVEGESTNLLLTTEGHRAGRARPGKQSLPPSCPPHCWHH